MGQKFRNNSLRKIAFLNLFHCFMGLASLDISYNQLPSAMRICLLSNLSRNKNSYFCNVLSNVNATPPCRILWAICYRNFQNTFPLDTYNSRRKISWFLRAAYVLFATILCATCIHQCEAYPWESVPLGDRLCSFEGLLCKTTPAPECKAWRAGSVFAIHTQLFLRCYWFPSLLYKPSKFVACRLVLGWIHSECCRKVLDLGVPFGLVLQSFQRELSLLSLLRKTMNESVIDIFRGSMMPIEGQTPFKFTST